jgi:teichuronic acid biosynthesis glycosyltransferase TuaG
LPFRSPLVSIVTPAFNAGATLRGCIASVAEQTQADWEHLVVDDGSADATPALMAEAAGRDGRLRAFSTGGNRGAAYARNLALAAARGRFLAFLDADDLWLPGKLEAQLRFMRESGAGLSYGSYFVAAGEDAPRRFFQPPAAVTYAELLRGCPIGCSTVMIDRDKTGAVAMPDLRRGQDWALWLALARRGVAMAAFPGVHTIYSERPGSLSSNKLRKLADVLRIYRASEGLTAMRSGGMLLRHALYVLWKRRRGLHAVARPPDA